jgi:hypothetical protein
MNLHTLPKPPITATLQFLRFLERQWPNYYWRSGVNGHPEHMDINGGNWRQLRGPALTANRMQFEEEQRRNR